MTKLSLMLNISDKHDATIDGLINVMMMTSIGRQPTVAVAARTKARTANNCVLHLCVCVCVLRNRQTNAHNSLTLHSRNKEIKICCSIAALKQRMEEKKALQDPFQCINCTFTLHVAKKLSTRRMFLSFGSFFSTRIFNQQHANILFTDSYESFEALDQFNF